MYVVGGGMLKLNPRIDNGRHTILSRSRSLFLLAAAVASSHCPRDPCIEQTLPTPPRGLHGLPLPPTQPSQSVASGPSSQVIPSPPHLFIWLVMESLPFPSSSFLITFSSITSPHSPTPRSYLRESFQH